jgi:site-specific DNA recombinase
MYIAIYGRVSTEKQYTDGFGLDVQLKELISEAQENKLEYKTYIDQGISGTSINKRLGLQNMLDDVEKGIVKEVWVTKLSRLGRNTRDVLNIIHELEKRNVVFKSKRDGIDTSNQMGKIMLQFMSIVSEMERDIIIETTRAGADYRASIGKIYGCAPIFGYDRIGSGKNSQIIINEEESKAVKTIFNMYLRGHGYKAIANYLNESGIRSKKGNLFAISTIRAILESPLYVGMIRYNLFKNWNVKRRRGRQDDDSYILVDGLHENIISRTKWDKVQTKLKESKGTRKNVIYGRFPLNSILKCPECGSGMAGMTTRYQTKKGVVERRAYICSTYQNKGKIACGIHSIKAIDIENSVFSILDNFFQNNQDKDVMQILKPDYIREIILSKDGQLKRKLMKKLIKSILVEEKGKKILGMEFLINEETFDFLDAKYTEKNATEITKMMESLNYELP